MYISQYLVQNEKSFDVWWMFRKESKAIKSGESMQFVCFGSLKYLYILNSSEFLITNHRTFPRGIFWKKKKNQKYIMTWHGAMPIKMVEKDALKALGDGYEYMAKKDSKNCDLMISDSKWFSSLLRNSFWYDGEILQSTIPRNKKFYDKDNYKNVRNKVLSFFGEKKNTECLLVLYAPTFRTDHSTETYITEWDDIKNIIETKFGKKAIILMRLHPTLLKDVDTTTLIKSEYVKNASIYSDMQELMVAADLLITDYSSTMFEFSLMHKPCFLYMPDKETYDRGFYFKLSELPFVQSESINDLISDIGKYSNDTYQCNIEAFVNERFGLYEPSDGSAKVCEWIKQHSIR